MIGFTLCACILPDIVDFSAHLSRPYTPRHLLDNLFLAWVTKGGTDLHSKRQCVSYRPLVSPVQQRRQVLYIGRLLGQFPPFSENKKFPIALALAKKKKDYTITICELIDELNLKYKHGICSLLSLYLNIQFLQL